MTELILQQNQMTTEATKTLLTVLGKHKVILIVLLIRIYFFFFSKQTLTKIVIESNEMTEDAVQSLINAFKSNTVTEFHIWY